MAGDWTRSDNAAPVLALTLDQRPAWLWSAAGERPVWRNVAAVAHRARVRKKTAKLAPTPVPIKGQVARLIKLGTPGRASLSRLRFLAGGKPVSATCLCTPIELGGELHLLIVDTEALDAVTASGPAWQAALGENLFADRRAYLIEVDGKPIARHGEDGRDAGGNAGDRSVPIRGSATLVLFDRARPERETALPFHDAGEPESAAGGGLTGLVDRLARAHTLYAPLDEGDDVSPETPPPPPPVAAPFAPEGADRYVFALGADGTVYTGDAEGAAGAPAPAGQPGFAADAPFEIAAPDGGPAVTAIPVFDRRGAHAGWRGYAAPAAATQAGVAPVSAAAPAPSGAKPPGPGLWSVSGRGFVASTSRPAGETSTDTGDDTGGDRQSRYNFDELSRILSDRIIGEEAPGATRSAQGGDLVPLSDETLVLNRLPLGLLVFRDQVILFANRAMADLAGYESTSALREAGLESLFPEPHSEARSVGLVARLSGRDGEIVPVVARLQTISWQGRQAYLLSARPAESAGLAEAVGMTTRATVELIAAQSDCGFIQLTRTGNIDGISDLGASLIGP
ncbi:MAG TPA: PAS domain-containing protein, partial [Devosiaceae bacterium]|nr:PAS domain-containing protein [Devosiaceae bacterium]